MRLTAYVYVADGDAGDGVMHGFGPDDDVPDWARRKITNPDVWVDDSPDADTEDGAPQEPPRAGRGSGRDEWAAFAQAHDVTVDDDASRDDIIATLAERGVIEG